MVLQMQFLFKANHFSVYSITFTGSPFHSIYQTSHVSVKSRNFNLLFLSFPFSFPFTLILAFLSLLFSESKNCHSTFHLAIRLLTYFSRLTLSLVLIFLSLLHSCSSHFHFSSDLTFPLLFLLLLLPFSSNFHSTFSSLLLRLSLSLYFPPTFILLIHWLFLSISTRFLFLSLIWVSSLSLSHPYWNFSILSSSFSLVFIPNLSLLNRFTLGLLFYTTLYDLIFNTHTIALFQSVAPCTNKIWKSQWRVFPLNSPIAVTWITWLPSTNWIQFPVVPAATIQREMALWLAWAAKKQTTEERVSRVTVSFLTAYV